MELDIGKFKRDRKTIDCLKAGVLTGLFLAMTSDSQACLAQPCDGQRALPVKAVTDQISAPSPTHNLSGSGKPRLKVGLALGGGGMRGAAHIGVLEVLEREGVHIDYIAGTSMGSVVGGLYAAGVPICQLEDRFTHGIVMKHFMTAPVGIRLAVAPAFLPMKALGSHQYDGLYRGNIFRKYLNRSVPQDDKNIESFKIPFCAVALNLIDGKPYALAKGNFGRALQASCALPVLRRPVKIDDKLFVDGGVLVNLPTQQVRNMGADIVIAVDVDERINDLPMSEFEKLGSVVHRVICLHLSKIDQENLKLADIVIHPEVNGIRMVSTKKKDAKAAVAAGVEACKKLLPDILKLVGPENLMVEGKLIGTPQTETDTTRN
jgi:NTE family protein